ncbi:MAG: hypothetical protein R2831_11885 [Chitinophagaceae bacterium]
MSKELYNKYDKYKQLDKVYYMKDENQTQFLELKTPKGFVIRITIPDSIFEWFVNILDDNGNELNADWTEHYGKPKEILKAERQKDIEDFIEEILKGKIEFEGKSLLDEFYYNRSE